MSFTFRTLDQINECTYDPPGVSNGTKPTFEAGAAVRRLTAQSAGNVNVQVDIDDDEETTGPSKTFGFILGGAIKFSSLKKSEEL